MRTKSTTPSSLFTIMLLIVVSFFPLVTAYRYPVFLNDDSYITLAYAKNLVNGNGFVFNHPPAVLGTTTPLFTILVAGLSWITKVDIVVVAVFLSAFCWLGIAWIFFFFRKEWQLASWQIGILALVLVGSGWIASLGMESYLFAFLLVLSISLLLRESYWLTGFTIGLLFLTRGEGVLVIAVSSIAILIRDWVTRKSIDVKSIQKLLKVGFSFAFPVLIWAVYAHFTFGSFLPNTLAAKEAQAQSGLWRPFLQRLIDEWIPLWGKSFDLGTLPFVNFWWIAIIIGFASVLLHKGRWLILVGWIILYVVGYSLINVSAYGWYQRPILFVLNLLFGLGIITIVETTIRYMKPRNLSLAISLVIAITAIVVLAKPTLTNMLAYKGDPRGQSYVTLSRWFREHALSSESIAFIEIGYLGYYTDNRIIDLAGLILPDVPSHIAKRDFSWGFWQYTPDYYIYLPDFDWALASIRDDPRFDQQYRIVVTLPGPRDTDFAIYKRISQ